MEKLLCFAGLRLSRTAARPIQFSGRQTIALSSLWIDPIVNYDPSRMKRNSSSLETWILYLDQTSSFINANQLVMLAGTIDYELSLEALRMAEHIL